MRPVDMQTMIPKMTELARVYASEGSRHLIAAQQGSEDTKAMVNANLREVRAKKDAQSVILSVGRESDKEGKKKQKNRGGKRGAGPPGGQPSPDGGRTAGGVHTAGGIRNADGVRIANGVPNGKDAGAGIRRIDIKL